MDSPVLPDDVGSGKLSIDECVAGELSHVKKFVNIETHGYSLWATSYRIDAEIDDGVMQSYFLKVSTGSHGRESLKGEFVSSSAIWALSPNLIPRPIASGTFMSKPDTHFYLCEYRILGEDMPNPQPFCQELAELHRKGNSPNGKYGYDIVTYNGNLPQDNNFCDTWEEFFANGLRHMYNLNFDACGPSEEMETLMPAIFQKVIPRLLRPIEKSIKPSLVHGDLWCGNTAADQLTGNPLIYDPCCFYAHNEYELGNWRPARNCFSRRYFEEYHSHFPRTPPETDYDDRNALYGMRFNLHAATMFPLETHFRESVIEEMRRLTAKFPDGYEEYIK